MELPFVDVSQVLTIYQAKVPLMGAQQDAKRPKTQ